MVSAHSVQLTSLVSFANTNGSEPNTSLTLGSDGNFYGTTFYGGSQDYGTVFKVTTDGELVSLISFATTPTNGAYPDGSLTLGTDGNLYGTTFASGRTGGSGTVFRITTNGTLTTLVVFAGTNGANPQGALILGGDANFYGTTEVGGSGGAGTVFKVTTNGTLTSLVPFDAVADDGTSTYTYTNVDGEYPGDLILGNDGNFYGAAGSGGTGGDGTIFMVTTNGALTPLTSFDRAVYDDVSGLYSNASGAYPNRRLALGNDGCFYGSTSDGGTNRVGTIFKVTTNGVLAALATFAAAGDNQNAQFTNANGAFPSGGLVLGNDGNFYGVTSSGGVNGSGTIFNVTANGVITTLFAFAAGQYNESGNYTNANGAVPHAVLTLGTNGNFYGTTAQGGSGGYGTVFKLNISTLESIPLSISANDNQAVLIWTNSAFSLQSAPDITGTFTNVPGATSPYTNNIAGQQQYFRLISN